MATKPDFAQKLLHDLRLRKQRMAITQNSDMHGNSRQNFNGSKGTKTLEPVGSKIGSTYRSSSNSQKSPATAQTANQIVPYSGDYRSGQVADLSMALSYAFDNRGKLKRLDIASNSAMMNLLKSIGSRSMQQSLNIQWQSTNQFPTLTHLHINEIAKGAQKLNQILRACSNGINIDEVSVDIGKDLWKGAMELEQSLRMLVSLQEVSESTGSQKNKSRLKLLDENGDSEDDSSVGSGKQKQVERPVFSFDKPSKKTKASVQTDLQQKLKALPYQQDPNSKPERSESMTPKGTHSHRRSASCGPEFQTSQITDSSKSKHNAARLPNVIAKLMGLEELPQNINQKVATESQLSQKRSRELVSVHTAQRSSRSADLKTEYTKNTKIQTEQSKVQSNKITILTTHKIQLQEETYRSTNSHKTTSGLENPRWNEEEREGIKDYVKESKAAIFKINELQSKTIHLNQDGESHKDITKEAKLESMKQRQHEVEDVTETMHTYTPDNSNTRKASKTAATKPLIPQQTQNRDVSYEPQGKKLRAEDQSQQREKNNSELRKKEHSAEILQSSRSVARDLKKMQKQQPIKQQNARKKSAEHTGLGDTKASLSYRQIEDPLRDGKDGKFKNLDDKQKSSVSLKADQNDPSTNGQSESHKTECSASSNVNTKSTHDTTRKVVTDVKPFKIRPVTKTNEVTTKTVTAPRIIAGALRPQKASSHRQKKNKLDKINISRKAPEANERKSKSAESIPGNHKTTKPVCEESQQNVDAEQMDTKNHTVRDDPSQRLKGVTKLTPGDEGENTISTVTDNQQEQLIANKEEVRLDITATDGQDDTKKNSSNQQQKQQPIKMEKQEPLTEDELFLKQKLIKSHLFLNTAEALFKLNIPISILNYASDQIFEEKNSKIILDCGYELLKRKGRQDIFFYSSINIFMTCKKFRSLDDLVRQLHKDFEALRSYGRNVRGEYDDYDSCVERDIYNKHPDLNCMWDLGWNEVMFPCTKMDEVISTIEQLMLEELVNEVTNDCL